MAREMTQTSIGKVADSAKLQLHDIVLPRKLTEPGMKPLKHGVCLVPLFIDNSEVLSVNI